MAKALDFRLTTRVEGTAMVRLPSWAAVETNLMCMKSDTNVIIYHIILLDPNTHWIFLNTNAKGIAQIRNHGSDIYSI
jgi:hypothetical protein